MLSKPLILQLNQPINLKQFLFIVFFSLFTVYGVTAQVAVSAGMAYKPVHSLNDLLYKNFLLQHQNEPVKNLQQLRKVVSKDLIFYILLGLFFYLAILRAAFPRYFGNLVRVFFNTSLRQSQLTDQLLQDRLPALCLNIFFACVGGVFLYLILNKFGISAYNNWKVLLYTIPAIALVYLGKYFILLFTGWLTGFKQEAGTYTFIVFLFNKILSLFLLPLAVVIAFADKSIAEIAMMISFIVVGLWLLLRFYRSYSLLQHRLKVTRFHFFLFIIGIEMLPILFIYKAAVLIMLKNL
jgi:hypothetical protein